MLPGNFIVFAFAVWTVVLFLDCIGKLIGMYRRRNSSGLWRKKRQATTDLTTRLNLFCVSEQYIYIYNFSYKTKASRSSILTLSVLPASPSF